jgi:hypothetical protein
MSKNIDFRRRSRDNLDLISSIGPDECVVCGAMGTATWGVQIVKHGLEIAPADAGEVGEDDGGLGWHPLNKCCVRLVPSTHRRRW